MSDLNSWVKEYGVDGNFEETSNQEDIVQYLIPSYKINRLLDIEAENKKLRNEIESVIRDNYNLKDKYIRVIGVNDEYVIRNSTLAKEKEKLREALGNLLHHCERYNRAEESLVLAMEMETAYAALRELEGEK